MVNVEDSMMERSYITVDDGNFWGSTVDEAYHYLKSLHESSDKDYKISFNDKWLYSDMSIDDMYRIVTGMTKEEYDIEMDREIKEAEEQERQHKEKIPELIVYWNEWGKQNLKSRCQKKWQECVPIRLDDLYQGWELDCFKEVVEIYKASKKEERLLKIKEILENQGHSGMSYHLMCSLIYTFLDKKLGKELCKH